MAIRPVNPTVPSNYTGHAPLPTTPKSDGIVKRSRPDFPAPENNPLAKEPITASSTLVRAAVPPDQGGTVSGKAILEPIKPGYSRSSVINLLVAGNQENLNRQISASLEQESKTLEKATEKKHSKS